MKTLPWIKQPQTRDDAGLFKIKCGAGLIASDLTEEDCDRIIAEHNACQGIDNPEFEIPVLKDRDSRFEPMYLEIRELHRVLKGILDQQAKHRWRGNSDEPDSFAIARDVLKKIKN